MKSGLLDFHFFQVHRAQRSASCCSKLWACYKAQGSGEGFFLFTEHLKDLLDGTSVEDDWDM